MYQFYMGDVLLPVTPSGISIKISNQNKTVTLINEGEINILKSAGLSKISFDALLPNKQYPFARYQDGFKNAQYFLSALEKLKTSLSPFEFNVIHTDDRGIELMSFDTINVSLETYQIDEDAEKYGTDVMVNIELLQYRTYGTKTLEFKKQDNTTKATVTENRDTSTKPKVSTYTVIQGDNLWDIAKKQLGDGSRSSEIYNLNKDIIEQTAKKYGRASSSNGWWIYPDTVLQLPT